HAALLALRDLRSSARRGEETAQACPAGADPLGERALRIQLHLQLAREELALELLVLADVAADHLPHLPGLQQHPEALVGRAAVVGDDGEVLHALAVDGLDQVLRVAAEAEPARDRKSTRLNSSHT